jgi:hypothetical protein
MISPLLQHYSILSASATPPILLNLQLEPRIAILRRLINDFLAQSTRDLNVYEPKILCESMIT